MCVAICYVGLMRTHQEIVEQAGTDAEVALALQVKPHVPRDWRLRNSIPADRWDDVVAAGFSTLEELASAAKARRLAAANDSPSAQDAAA